MSFAKAIASMLPVPVQMVLRHHYLVRRVASGRLIDEPELAALPLVVHPEMDVLDIGANVGGYTLALSKLARSVTAFEPIRANFAVLTAAVRSPKVKALQVAVGAFDGTIEMVVPPTMEGYYLARFDDGGPGERIQVRIVTLDRLLSEGTIPAPKFIKCDVEGAEYEVIAGAGEVIGAHHPAWLMEVFSRKADKVFPVMQGFGYVPHVYDASLHQVSGFVGGHENYFFL